MSSSAVKSIPNILNRDTLGDDLEWVIDPSRTHDKDYLVRQINRIKNKLIKSGVQKGDKITISLLQVDDLHVASIIACAELGLILFLLDSPATEESLPYTKVALHGPTQWYISAGDSGRMTYGGLHGKLLDRYCGQQIDILDMDMNVVKDTQPSWWTVDDTDPLLLSSTSGTTKPSRPVMFSHREVMEISKRNVKVFNFDETSSVGHSKNLHHASAMLTSLIPSLMVAKYHITFALGEMDADYLHPIQFLTFATRNPSHIMISNKESLRLFLEMVNEPFTRTLNINMCGFTLDSEFAKLAQEYNLRFYSHYGSIDTAIPFLLNIVDKDSIVEENCLGVMPDQFYGMVMDGNRVEIHCDLWDEPRYIEDELEFRDGQFFLIKPRQLDLPDIDLTPFMSDTKVSMEQLRGHLHETGYYSKRHSD